MTDPLHSEYMDAREAAARLGYTVQHTRFLLREGRLPGLKFGRDWLVPRSAVEAQVTDSGTAKAEKQTEGGLSTQGEDDYQPRNLIRAVNVSQVPQRSPFRYPGGKTWLVPLVRSWLRSLGAPIAELFEPFAGGGIVSLTAVFEGLANRATMVELDEDVAAVWTTILGGNGTWLAQRVLAFEPTHRGLQSLFCTTPASVEERAFVTLVRNRVARGGILAPGAGIVKHGENRKGVTSRWYPQTLSRRILAIAHRRQQIRFICGDGMRVLGDNAHRAECAWFIDPPYTVAGRRLYRYSEVEHDRLFRLARGLAGDFLITYDDAPEIRYLARKHRLDTRVVSMTTTHHRAKRELLIGRSLQWLAD